VSVASAAFLPVFVLAEDSEAAQRLRVELGRVPGWNATSGVDLPSRLARLFWGHEAGQGEAGVSALVDHERFVHALRRLADGLVAAALPLGATTFVDVVADGELLGPYVRMVWPEAVVVAIAHGVPTDRVAAAAPDVVVTVSDVAADAAAVAARVVAIGREHAAMPSRRSRILTWRPSGARRRLTDSPLRGQLVVVLGAPRSGTTWLHRLLCANPEIAGTETGETWLFPDVAPVWADPIRAVAGDAPTLAAMRGFCDELLGAMRDRVAPQASHVCEKTPTTVWQLPLLSRLYPDAHYVHVIRDGRDVAMSLTLTRGDSGDLGVAAREWVDAVNAVRDASPSLPRLTEIRYEELLADPRTVIEGVWRKIGVPVPAVSYDVLTKRVDERVTPLPASGKIGAGKWRTLPDADRELVEGITAGLLTQLGYPVGAA
jgi:hypothetical protein